MQTRQIETAAESNNVVIFYVSLVFAVWGAANKGKFIDTDIFCSVHFSWNTKLIQLILDGESLLRLN